MKECFSDKIIYFWKLEKSAATELPLCSVCILVLHCEVIECYVKISDTDRPWVSS